MVQQYIQIVIAVIVLFSISLISFWILNSENENRFFAPTIYQNRTIHKKWRNAGHETLPERLKNLTYIYETYNGTHRFDHWKEYAVHYEQNLYPILRKLAPDKTFRMLEIGVQSGGSVNVWKSYFSRSFYYVGMDIDKRCKRSEDINHNIFIEIGSQMNVKDLANVCKKHGPFHFIVDDGGHTFKMMQVALKTLFISDQCMEDNSLYVLEDMHTMVIKPYSNGPTDIPSIPAELFRKMHYYWYVKQFPAGHWEINYNIDKEWANRIKSIALYDSMMFVHRKQGHGPLTRISRGNDTFSNDERKLQPNEYLFGKSPTIKWGWKQW